MKKKIYLLFLILVIPVISFSQINFVSGGVYGGVMLPMGDFADVYKVSPLVGAEGFYNVTPNIDIIADVAYTFLSPKLGTWENATVYMLESSAGARYNFTPTKEKIFIEAGLGAYTMGVKYTYTVYGVPTTYDVSSTDFGVNAGVGALIPLSPQFSVAGKIKFHNIFTSGSSNNFFSLTAGINYLFR